MIRTVADVAENIKCYYVSMLRETEILQTVLLDCAV